MDTRLRGSAAASFALHAALLLALLIAIPTTIELPQAGEQGVSMVFEGGKSAPAIKSTTTGPTPSVNNQPKVVEGPAADLKPLLKPDEVPPPPPPPPPTPPQPPTVIRPSTIPVPPTPPLPESTSQVQTHIPPPPPQKQPITPSQADAPPTPPTPPPPVLKETKTTTTTQPLIPPKSVPFSQSTQSTIEKLRLASQQTQPPKAVYNSEVGGAPGGGSPNGDITSKLSAGEAGRIGDDVRRCWTADFGAKGIDQMQVGMVVVTDAAGVARDVQVADADRGKMSDPVFRAFAERAVRAVLNVQCANLPLPTAMLGRPQRISFRFKPGE